MTSFRCKAIAGLLLASLAFTANALEPEQQRLRDIYSELIGIDTTHDHGSTTIAAKAMADRLLAAGFPADDVQIFEPAPTKGNLVVRLRSPEPARKPLLMMAHLDVVEAKPEDWSVPPFELLEQDGYFYGRGTKDDKAMAAIFVANLIRMREAGFAPDRDLILMLTADEEGGPTNGVDWLIRNQKDLIDAEFAINEGGGGALKAGKRLSNNVQASEKVFVSFTLHTTNAGGHSSMPRPDNAIYQLATALTRLSEYAFPPALNEVTRGWFEARAALETGQTAADITAILAPKMDGDALARLSRNPYFNALLRTTCVATMLDGGHAENALPQSATATVNCRMLPGTDPRAVQQALADAIGDSGVEIKVLTPADPGPASPLTAAVMGPIAAVTEAMYPGVPVVPTMSTGATDGKFLRAAGIPVYGVSGIFSDVDDNRAHGRDERLEVSSLYEGQAFLYQLVVAFASPEPGDVQP